MIDVIQRRYGWTDDVILRMPYARFVQVARVAAEAEAREARERFREAAFVGWQVYLCQPLEKGRRHMGFPEWLRSLGLEEPAPKPRPLPPEEARRLREQALEKAAKIIALDKQRRQKTA